MDTVYVDKARDTKDKEWLKQQIIEALNKSDFEVAERLQRISDRAFGGNI